MGLSNSPATLSLREERASNCLAENEMSAFKSYGKIGAEPSSWSHGKRALVLVICSVVLVVAAGCVGFGLLHEKKIGLSGTRSQDLIEKLCNVTLYFKVCNSSLSAYPGALQATASELARIAVEVSRDEADGAYDLTLDLKNRPAGGEDAADALEDYVELLGDTVDELNASLSIVGNPNWSQNTSGVSDVKRWLSAALTNPSTFAEEFEDADVGMPPDMKHSLEYLSQLISNALAIVKYVSAVETGMKDLQKNRRLLVYGSHFSYV